VVREGRGRRLKAEDDAISGDNALRWSICGVVLSLLGLLCGIAGGPRHAAGGEARYVYDSLNRLVAVTDEAGAVAVYHYDAVGNLLTITRHGEGDVVILDFSPQRGRPGSLVRLHGLNFSADPSGNRVAFAGGDAVVRAATSTELQVEVPPDAVTGPIRVTVGTAEDATAAPFVVVRPAEIAAVSPSYAQQGSNAELEISGQGFQGTTEIRLMPPDGVTPTAPFAVEADGTRIRAFLTIAAGALLGERRFIVVTPDGESVAETPGADRVVIVSGDAITTVSAGVRVSVPLAADAVTTPVRVAVEPPVSELHAEPTRVVVEPQPDVVITPPVKVEQMP